MTLKFAFFFPNTYVSKIKIHCNACKVSTKGVSVAETNPVKCLFKHSCQYSSTFSEKTVSKIFT